MICSELAQILVTMEAGQDDTRNWVNPTCPSILAREVKLGSLHFKKPLLSVPWAPASLFWPQLAALLAPWLRWDDRGAARWRDAALHGTARDRYLADNELAVRTTLATYYEVNILGNSSTVLSAML